MIGFLNYLIGFLKRLFYIPRFVFGILVLVCGVIIGTAPVALLDLTIWLLTGTCPEYFERYMMALEYFVEKTIIGD